MEPKKRLNISIPLWWPDLPKNLRSWLPTRGNVLFTTLMIALLVWAQTAGAFPALNTSVASTGTIAYQGRLADSGGNPLTTSVNMIFRLYNAATGGAPLWQENWTGPNSVQVSDGLFNVMLGSLTAIPQGVITGNPTLFLGITAGTDDEMAPRVQLGSVPFAVQALTVPDGSITTDKIADGAITSDKLGQSIHSESTFTMTLPSWVSTTSKTTAAFGSVTLPEKSDLYIMSMWTLQNNTAVGGLSAALVVDGVRKSIYSDDVSLSSIGIGFTIARNHFIPGVAAGNHTLGVEIDQFPFRSGEDVNIGPGSVMWIRAVPTK